MARLVNISGTALRVGGWEKDLSRTGVPTAPGTAMSLPRLLNPGQSVDIPVEVIHHPLIKNAVDSGNFRLEDVQLVPGGPVDADVSVQEGVVQKLTKTLTFADLTAAATSQVIGIGALPANTHVLDVYAVSGGVWDAGTMAITLGSASDTDALAGSMDIDVVADVTVPWAFTGTAQSRAFASGLDVVAAFTSDANVDGNTTGSVTITVLFTVLA